VGGGKHFRSQLICTAYCIPRSCGAGACLRPFAERGGRSTNGPSHAARVSSRVGGRQSASREVKSDLKETDTTVCCPFAPSTGSPCAQKKHKHSQLSFYALTWFSASLNLCPPPIVAPTRDPTVHSLPRTDVEACI